MRSGKIFIYITWFIAVGLLFVITMYNQNRVDSFLGLTESKEHSLNFPHDVSIKTLYVVAGQKVKKGEKLAEVMRVGLAKDEVNYAYKIQLLVDKLDSKKIEIKGALNELKAKKDQELLRLDSNIEILKTKKRTQQRLLQMVDDNSHYHDRSLDSKIKIIQQKKATLKKVFDVKKTNLLISLETNTKDINSRIKALKEKQDFKNEIEILVAPYDADISEVSYKEGASVKSFSSIITLHPLYPSYIKGYIHEDIQTKIALNQRVLIQTNNASNQSETPRIEGIVKSISTRIVNFPVRLKKYKVVPLWGYKVIIEIPKNNLKLGQKVVISQAVDENRSDAKFFQMLHSIKLH